MLSSTDPDLLLLVHSSKLTNGNENKGNLTEAFITALSDAMQHHKLKASSSLFSAFWMIGYYVTSPAYLSVQKTF